MNDLAGQCIKYIQQYVDLTKDSQNTEDILIVTTDHRGVFKDLRKGALAVKGHCNTVQLTEN